VVTKRCAAPAGMGILPITPAMAALPRMVVPSKVKLEASSW